MFLAFLMSNGSITLQEWEDLTDEDRDDLVKTAEDLWLKRAITTELLRRTDSKILLEKLGDKESSEAAEDLGMQLFMEEGRD